MYHLVVGGKMITDLRLSGETLGKIFTGVIRNWDDPQITARLRTSTAQQADHSGGAGGRLRHLGAVVSCTWPPSTPTLWNAFCQKYAGQQAALWPYVLLAAIPGSVAQTGSNLVANYVAASYGDGAIGYDEYAYAKARSYPVVALLNDAGYYVTPTASNVAVALTGRQDQQ